MNRSNIGNMASQGLSVVGGLTGVAFKGMHSKKVAEEQAIKLAANEGSYTGIKNSKLYKVQNDFINKEKEAAGNDADKLNAAEQKAFKLEADVSGLATDIASKFKFDKKMIGLFGTSERFANAVRQRYEGTGAKSYASKIAEDMKNYKGNKSDITADFNGLEVNNVNNNG